MWNINHWDCTQRLSEFLWRRHGKSSVNGQESRKEEQTRRGTTLIKVVSSLSPSPTHQGLQYWHRAMQPVVGGSWRGGDRGLGSHKLGTELSSFSYLGASEGKLSKYLCSRHTRHGWTRRTTRPDDRPYSKPFSIKERPTQTNAYLCEEGARRGGTCRPLHIR